MCEFAEKLVVKVNKFEGVVYIRENSPCWDAKPVPTTTLQITAATEYTRKLISKYIISEINGYI